VKKTAIEGNPMFEKMADMLQDEPQVVEVQGLGLRVEGLGFRV
jgi:hypothetical protein